MATGCFRMLPVVLPCRAKTDSCYTLEGLCDFNRNNTSSGDSGTPCGSREGLLCPISLRYTINKQ
jgi:hypothetical protein